MEASLEVDTIVEVREELMVSPSSGGNPTWRTAHFLKPSMNCTKETARDFLPPHSMFSGTVTSNPAKLPLEVRYNGWRGPHEEWKTWVEQMQPKYETLWIQAGIDQAIKASTYQIERNDALVLGLAQRWYSETNTFIFPWGEATITLEDMKVCGGYSIMGAPVRSPLETQEQKETEAELVAARRMFNKTKARKVVHKPWMMHFMKNESQVEHEAFLILWLSRFVFPANAYNTILKSVFPIAIHLARGTRIALAPAVLASIYRDLSLLNSSISNGTMKLRVTVTLWAPFQLVQIWALERFPAIHITMPQPNPIEQGQPRMARWHRVKMLKNKNLKLTLDSAGARNCFVWRPYENSPALKLYNEKDMWECDNPSIEGEMQSFARCLRVSELVGLEGTKQYLYLPHRVAMQFGMDQDVPGVVARCNKDPLISWRNYSQPIMYTELCSALLCAIQPNVTSRYYDWWKQSKLGKEEDPRKGSDHGMIYISSSEDLSHASSGQVEGEGSYHSYVPPPGFPPKLKRDQAGDFDQGDELAIKKLLSSSSEVRFFEEHVVGNGKALSSAQSGVLPSASSVVDETAGSMTGGVYNCARSKDVHRVSKRTTEDAETENVVRGASRTKEDANEAKMKSPFCNTNGVNDKEGESASACAVDIASDLDNRIWELERVVAKLKAAKFGSKLENSGAKANLSVP